MLLSTMYANSVALFAIFCLLITWYSSAAELTDKPVKLAVILPNESYHLFSWPRVGPALELAVSSLQPGGDRGHIIRRNFTLLYGDSKCSGIYGPVAAINFYTAKSVDVFVGPACSYAAAPIARFSPFWDIPVITAGALVSHFQKKESEYKLLTRMIGSYQEMGNFFVDVMSKFNWSVTGLLFHDHISSGEGHSSYYFMSEAIFLALKNKYNSTKNPWWKSFDEKVVTDEKIGELLQEVSLHARIIVLCASQDAVRSIMLKAHELNMTNSGEYAFFNIDLFNSKSRKISPWHHASSTEDENIQAQKAYEALMTVTMRMPETEKFENFSKKVKQLAKRNYNFDYGEEEVNSFVSAFHDAVILYALALNETIGAGFNESHGSEVTKRMWNRTFEGITGKVAIDSNGDRNADYSLLDMNPDTGHFEVVANYYGVEKMYVPVPGKAIHWSGGRTQPPPDTPECGFDNSGCPDLEEEKFPVYAIASIVLCAIVVCLLIASIFIYRYYKLEAELTAMNWRIRWDDIMFGTMEKQRQTRAEGGRAASISKSDVSGETIALQDMNKQIFAKTGYYKGTLIAIRKINKSKIELNRSLLMEFKKIRDLQHDHITRFIGACVDPPNACFIVEYCPKGSLEDILENDQIKLDWMFRYSLIHDIVKGMQFLHNSEIRSHGNLKSSNCVVDSRFVLKVTDFGLLSLRESEEVEEDAEDSFKFYQRKLWTAPELLRLQISPPGGTQKGDVYSFGIILQEIIMRQGPFYIPDSDLSPKEIVEMVRNGVIPPYRPYIDETECDEDIQKLVSRCWSEDPFERPEFGAIRQLMRKLHKGGEGSNILDNLLSRMEQYANNLESLVEARTADYLEQKQKAEDLLYQLLPKSVATSLIAGQCVQAESFDQTTIYFSDIVGFTSMSAQSTPMQVVSLLNDLYTCFDSIIENFDVYKVETIGDAYMVVSGLPVRNGCLHAREIARMSLSLLKAVLSFKIRHRPNEQLKLRIGMHTGPCVAGVVGLKMPRYCLFGDTVNTASRMESNGLPLKIHVSPDTKKVLDTFKTFKLLYRGEVEMKGKGKLGTYFLEGEEGNDIKVPDLANCRPNGHEVVPTAPPPTYSSLQHNSVSAAEVHNTDSTTQPLLQSENKHGSNHCIVSSVNSGANSNRNKDKFTDLRHIRV